MIFYSFLNDARELPILSSSGNRFHNLAQVIFGAKSDRKVGEKGICRFHDDRVFTFYGYEISQNNVKDADGSSPARKLEHKGQA